MRTSSDAVSVGLTKEQHRSAARGDFNPSYLVLDARHDDSQGNTTMPRSDVTGDSELEHNRIKLT